MSVLIFWELENIASISFWVLPDLFVSYSAEKKKKKAGSVAFVTCHSEYLVGRTALRLLMVFLGCFVNFCYKICFQKTFQCSLLIPQKYWCISYLSFFFFCRGKCCLKRCYMQWHVILLPIFKYSHRPHVLEGKMSILRQLNEQIPF